MATSVEPFLVDGTFLRPGGRTPLQVHDPADGSVVGRAARATAEDARAAMDAAARAQPAWEALGGAARGRILLRAAEILRGQREPLARLITREMGKVLYEARGEADGAIENLEYYAAFGRTLSGEEVALLPRGQSLRLLWVPRGVVVALTPWNFPAATVTRKIAPALLAGNTMVLKGASATPLTALFLARALTRAGLPAGVLNVLQGSSAELGPALVGHPACTTVTLTGSTATGVEILREAAPAVVKCLLELGGKAPVIVAADADLDWAARATVWARFWNAGQACIAAERVYVDERVARPFLAKLTALIGRLRVGPGLTRGIDMGPLYSPAARDHVHAMVEAARVAGARIPLGGAVPARGVLARGAFYPPTLVTGLTDDSPLITEEIFGPVLPILTYRTIDEVIGRANHCQYGLSSYVFTREGAVAERLARELKFGETYVNRVGPESPQGYHAGFRQSGLGGEGSRSGVTDYMQLKSVYVDWSDPPEAAYFFPYPK
ncbi:MAG: aldehyde dehydrogenase family protein [Thermoplasmata archaeon]